MGENHVPCPGLWMGPMWMVDEGVSAGGSWPEGGSEEEPSFFASQEGGAGMRVVTEKSEGREVVGLPSSSAMSGSAQSGLASRSPALAEDGADLYLMMEPAVPLCLGPQTLVPSQLCHLLSH